MSEINSSQKRATINSLNEYERAGKDKTQAICHAYASGGYSMKEVGVYFGLHYSRVSRIIAKAKDKT